MRRIFGIALGVVCLHAVLLWRMQLGPQPQMALAPIFLIQMNQTAPVPLPVSGPKKPPARAAKEVKTADHQAIHNFPLEKQVPPKSEERLPTVKNPQPNHDKPANLAATLGPTNMPSAATLSAPGMSETAPEQLGTTTVAPTVSLQLPSSAADYLNNPAPIYPTISQRMGEQGKVIVRVLIAKDGSARQAEIHQSSGFDRLDQAALLAVASWRFVPGQRDGVPQDMWFNVPINFALK
jgi:protein TonB